MIDYSSGLRVDAESYFGATPSGVCFNLNAITTTKPTAPERTADRFGERPSFRVRFSARNVDSFFLTDHRTARIWPVETDKRINTPLA